MSVKETPETQAMQRWADEEAEALVQFMQRYVEPMADVGSPARVLGKPLEAMTEADMQMGAQIFGPGFDKWMANTMLRAAAKEQ